LLALALVVVALAGCASVPASRDDARADDPLEPLNRAVFDFNTALDRDVIEPVARAYRDVVPKFVRDRLRSVLDNLAEPRIFVNDVLQGRGDAAGITFARFFVNSTVGFVGFFDQATESGLPRQTGDFGQTLYTWGVADGPYLVLLFFGPSNVRDAIGLGIDLYTTPPAHVIGPHTLIGGRDAGPVELSLGVLDGLDLRSRNIETVEEMRKSALDPYTHFRSIFRQYRRAQLRAARGEKPEPEELVDPGASR
jgi:phospholipid-binding lipoprotein MlaA